MNPTQRYQNEIANFAQNQTLSIIDIDGENKLVPIRIPTQGQYVIIDALNFVVSMDTFANKTMKAINTNFKDLLSRELNHEQSQFLDEMLLDEIRTFIINVFGIEFTDITHKIGGLHGYKNSLLVKSQEGDILLNIAYGGTSQNNTVFFGLTGVGCRLATEGWENRLYDWLNTAVDAKISRVDLAHDDFNGNYSSFDWANARESDDAFMLPKSRIRPACRYAGEVKHKDPYNKGLTLYVGNRQNGKIIRCYEKGKQLGFPTSQWFRSELEIHNKKRLIPFDVLLNPTDYFCGAYPYCLELVNLAKKHGGDTTPQPLQTMQSVKNESSISLFRMIEIFKIQFGKHLKTMGELFTKNDEPDYAKIFDTLKTNKTEDYYPKRLRLPVSFFNRKDKLNCIVEFEKEFLEISHQNFIANEKQKRIEQKRQHTQKIHDDVMDYFYNTLKSGEFASFASH